MEHFTLYKKDGDKTITSPQLLDIFNLKAQEKEHWLFIVPHDDDAALPRNPHRAERTGHAHGSGGAEASAPDGRPAEPVAAPRDTIPRTEGGTSMRESIESLEAGIDALRRMRTCPPREIGTEDVPAER